MDINYADAMAYYAELASTPGSLESASDSDIEWHKQHLDPALEHLNPAYLAWRSLASAGEHAGFAEHMRFVTEGGVIARPHYGLARAVLLGAARATYILLPASRREQRIRAARLANKEAQDADILLQRWKDAVDAPASLDELRAQTKILRIKAGEILGEVGKNRNSSINESDLLRAALPAISNVFEYPERAVFNFWNRSSGVSHSRAWTWSLSTGEFPMGDFVSCWQTPIELLRQAWKLWNIRRGISTPRFEPPDDWEANRERWNRPADE